MQLHRLAGGSATGLSATGAWAILVSLDGAAADDSSSVRLILKTSETFVRHWQWATNTSVLMFTLPGEVEEVLRSPASFRSLAAAARLALAIERVAETLLAEEEAQQHIVPARELLRPRP